MTTLFSHRVPDEFLLFRYVITADPPPLQMDLSLAS